MTDSFVGPNGLAFSPDESVLYINDVRRGHIRVFDMLANGLPAKQTDRVFVDLRGAEPGAPDGAEVELKFLNLCEPLMDEAQRKALLAALWKIEATPAAGAIIDLMQIKP